MINRRSLAALACVAGAAVPALATAGPAAAAPAPTASAAATCSKLPAYPGIGYFTSLKATGLGCTSAKKVMVAHYKCRVKHGKAGTCSKVRSGSTYRCTERRVQGTENYNSRVTCKSGSKKVVYTYQQDK